MIPASSRIPNTRQKLPPTSRQDLASARAGPCRSRTTTDGAMLNLTESHRSTQMTAMPPSIPMTTAPA